MNRNNLTDIKFIVILVFVSLIIIIAAGAGNVVRNDDEALYAGIAREMYQHGEWWVPKFFDEPAFYKPPLTYWLMIVSYHIFGTGLFAARLPMVILSLFTVLLIYLIGRKLFGQKEGLLAGALFATSLGMLTYGGNALMDMPLTFVITLAVFCFIMALRSGRGFWIFAFWASTGVSTLVKGPISAVILLIFAASVCLIYKRFDIFRRDYSIAGMFTGLFFCLLWPVMLFKSGYYYNWLDFFIVRENFGKFSDTYYYDSVKFLYYILQHMIPWLFFILAALVVLFRRKLYKQEEFVIILLWALSIIAVFVFPQTKLKHFLFPVCPSAALMAAYALERYEEDWAVKAGYFLTSGFLFILFLLSLVITRVIPHNLIFCNIAGLIFLAIAIYYLARRKIIISVFSYGIYICLLLAALSGFNFQFIPKGVSGFLSGDIVYVVKTQVYNFEYTFNKKSVQIQNARQFLKYFKRGNDIIISESDLEEFFRELAIKPEKYEVKYSWMYWKKSIPLRAILQALKSGSIAPVSEKIMIIRENENSPQRPQSTRRFFKNKIN